MNTATEYRDLPVNQLTESTTKRALRRGSCSGSRSVRIADAPADWSRHR